MKNQDWEHEQLKDSVYAQERASLIEAEYYEYILPTLITAQIPFKPKKQRKDENRSDTNPIPTTGKESI